jgi:hypothetical protein
MTKSPISVQDLRRRIYVKAKAKPTWRFWGLYVHVCKMRLENCGLELHPEKTKIVYCKDDDRRRAYLHEKFDFLGYTFRATYESLGVGLPGATHPGKWTMRSRVPTTSLLTRNNWSHSG